MKSTLALVLILLTLALPCELNSQHSRFRHAKNTPPVNPAEDVADEPMATPKPRLDVTKLVAQADELLRLAQSIPPDVQQVSRGMLPKDTALKLKRIEKLSKQLRNGLY